LLRIGLVVRVRVTVMNVFSTAATDTNDFFPLDDRPSTALS
jgi:hypothetical protein